MRRAEGIRRAAGSRGPVRRTMARLSLDSAVMSHPSRTRLVTPRRPLVSSDTRALGALAALLVLVAGHRLVFDTWLARLDIFTQFLPWYAYLVERLRAFAVPGWNPHLFRAAAFVCGPFLQWNTYCCLQFAQFATWIPLALLGVELALRTECWRDRVIP